MNPAGISSAGRKGGPISGLEAGRFDPDITMRLHAKRHPPENSIGVSWVDVVVNDDDHFAAYRRGLMACIENFRSLPRFWITNLNTAQTPATGRFVERNLCHVIEAAATQERKDVALGACAANFAGFRRRKLAEDGHINRVLSMGDAGNLHERVQLLWIHVTGELAKRRFGFHQFGVDEAFDDD